MAQESEANKLKLRFKEWLFNTVKLKQYLSNFEDSQCNDIRLIEYLDEDTLANDIKINNKLHRKLILKKATIFQQNQKEFTDLLSSNKSLNEYSQIFEDNGILTLQHFKADIHIKSELQTMLKMRSGTKLNEIWSLFYQDNEDEDDDISPSPMMVDSDVK